LISTQTKSVSGKSPYNFHEDSSLWMLYCLIILLHILVGLLVVALPSTIKSDESDHASVGSSTEISCSSERRICTTDGTWLVSVHVGDWISFSRCLWLHVKTVSLHSNTVAQPMLLCKSRRFALGVASSQSLQLVLGMLPLALPFMTAFGDYGRP
jgi:hypothetical protein